MLLDKYNARSVADAIAKAISVFSVDDYQFGYPGFIEKNHVYSLQGCEPGFLEFNALNKIMIRD